VSTARQVGYAVAVQKKKLKKTKGEVIAKGTPKVLQVKTNLRALHTMC
jgi:hypothetical protein